MRLTRIGCAVLTLLCAAAVHARPVSVAEVVESYAAPKLGSAAEVSNASFSIGHLSFSMPSGTVAAVLGADGTRIGTYYRGAGTFIYSTADRDEFPVVKYNAKNSNIGVTSTADLLSIKEKFEDVLVFGGDAAETAGAAATAEPDAFTRHVQLFGREYNAPAGHLFALRAADAPLAKVARAEISGERQFVYVYDDVWDHAESLSVLRKPGAVTVQFKNALFSTPLSSQTIGRPARQPVPPRFLLTDVDVDLTASDRDDATLIVTETIVPQARALGAARFDQYYRYFIDADREPRRYNVNSVTDERGRKLSYSHSGDELVVALAEPVPAGKPVKLRFDISGNFLVRPGGDNYWELGVEPWFPQPRLNEQAYTFHAVVRAKKPFIPFSPGKTLRRETEGEYNVVETRLDQPVQFAAILAGKYYITEETRNGVTVRVANYAMKNAAAAKRLANLAFAAIDYYPLFLGPFPFTEINVIEKNDFGYGQAPPATVFITKEAFTPLTEEASDYSKGINMRFAHEIAHQYWGHVVKISSPEEQWLSESFADYSAALFMKQMKNAGEYDRALSTWRSDAKFAGAVAPIHLANRLHNPGDAELAYEQRRQLLYGKGPYLLSVLHRELGDQMFLTFLKSYQKSFRWKHALTGDVVGLLNFLSKKDYAPFFEQYFYGTALPEMPKR